MPKPNLPYTGGDIPQMWDLVESVVNNTEFQMGELLQVTEIPHNSCVKVKTELGGRYNFKFKLISRNSGPISIPEPEKPKFCGRVIRD